MEIATTNVRTGSEERFFCYLLHSLEADPRAAYLLIKEFSSAKRAIEEGDFSCWQSLGLSPAVIKKLEDLKTRGRLYEALSKDHEQAERSGYKFSTEEELDGLFSCLDPQERPLGIWSSGDGGLLRALAPRVAIVGTRRPTFYGRSVARDFAFTLGQLKTIVVSGLARGIDTVAHQSCLEAGGKTLAVLGTGLNICYPPENKKWQREIVPSRGLVLTEFPLSTQPSPHNFPRRNRLISALSLGVIVVEGRNNSGALITARWAAKQGKDVFAVPGNIDEPMSQAPNILIKEGAIPLTSREDLLETLPQLRQLAKSLRTTKEADSLKEGAPTPADPQAQRVIAVLNNKEPLGLETILNKTGLDLKEANELLLKLELSNAIKNCFPYGYLLNTHVSGK